jgi:PAS domain-containing protein
MRFMGGELVGYANARHHRAGQGCRPLKESERRFRLLATASPVRLYMLDRKGTVTNWNAGGRRIKGYLPEEIIGQHFSRF